jgi:hypothetical protein
MPYHSVTNEGEGGREGVWSWVPLYTIQIVVRANECFTCAPKHIPSIKGTSKCLNLTPLDDFQLLSRPFESSLYHALHSTRQFLFYFVQNH